MDTVVVGGFRETERSSQGFRGPQDHCGSLLYTTMISVVVVFLIVGISRLLLFLMSEMLHRFFSVRRPEVTEAPIPFLRSPTQGAHLGFQLMPDLLTSHNLRKALRQGSDGQDSETLHCSLLICHSSELKLEEPRPYHLALLKPHLEGSR